MNCMDYMLIFCQFPVYILLGEYIAEVNPDAALIHNH